MPEGPTLPIYHRDVDEPLYFRKVKCRKPMGKDCVCYRPVHTGPCACSCTLYNSPHMRVSVRKGLTLALQS